MRKTIICAVAVATATVPAAAVAGTPDKKKDKPAYCVPKTSGYNATGKLVSGTFTQTAGADTAKRGDDRYSGDIVVDVKKANRGPEGEQSYTLTNGRVKYRPGKDTNAAPGDRVKVKGKITRTPKKCASAADPVITLRKVDIKAKRS